MDDGSSDATAEMVGELADPRIRLVRHGAPQGVSAARNRGITEAEGPWVAFCDDDDLWAPDKLVRQLDVARAAGRGWAYGGAVHIDGRRRVHSGAPPPPPSRVVAALPRYNSVPAGASNVLVRSDLLVRAGVFDSKMRHLPDWDLWLRLAATGPPACAPYPLVGYRIHGVNASFDTSGMLAELDLIRARHGGAASRARLYRHLAPLSLRAGRRMEALGYLARAALCERNDDNRDTVLTDARMLMAHVGEVVSRRLGRPPSRRAAERQRRARLSDPHRAWKTAAQAWLDELPGVVMPGDDWHQTPGPQPR